MASGSVKSAPKIVDVTVNIADLEFEERGGWYRANKLISDVFNRTDILLVQTIQWVGTNMPIITQFDGNRVQFISPGQPTSAGYVTVRGIIL